MRVYFLAKCMLFRTDRSDKIITYHELRHLSAHHKLEFSCPADKRNGLLWLANLIDPKMPRNLG